MINYNNLVPKFLIVNDKGAQVFIKQPSINELSTLYALLLNNLSKLRKLQQIYNIPITVQSDETAALSKQLN